MAVINIGSGSVKLYQFSTLKTESKVTLLASGNSKNKDECFLDTFDAVTFFYNKAISLGEKVYIFGTEAMRRNGQKLAEKIYTDLGQQVDIIDGDTEAICGFLGAVSSTAPCPNHKTYAVLDVGGASSEISVGQKSPDFFVSIKTGAVDLYNRFDSLFTQSNDINFNLSLVYNYIDNLMDNAFLPNTNIDEVKLIGGSGINLAAMLKNQTVFDADCLGDTKVDTDGLQGLIHAMFSLSPSQRTKRFPFLEYKRALVLPYGVCVIYRTLMRLNSNCAIVSLSGLIEGYIKYKNIDTSL